MSQAAPVSVVIPTRNRPALLLATIESILAGHEQPAEIVVVDQSDSDAPSLEQLAAGRACQIKHRRSRQTGLSRARNFGVAAASHDLIAFCDDDMLAEPAWLATLRQAVLIAGPRTVVTGRVLASGEEAGGFAPSLSLEQERRVYRGRLRTDVLWGGNMLLTRSALDEVGPFDERLGAGSAFPAAEDNDYGLRLLRAGYQIVYEPAAVLYHDAWRPAAEFLPLRWRYGLGQGGFYAKYLGLLGRYALGRLGQDVRRSIWLAACLFRSQRREALGELYYLAGVLVGASRWLLSQAATR